MAESISSGQGRYYVLLDPQGQCRQFGEGEPGVIVNGFTFVRFASEAEREQHPAVIAHRAGRRRLIGDIELAKAVSLQAYAGKEENARRFLRTNPERPAEGPYAAPAADSYPYLRIDVDARGWDAWTAAQRIIAAADRVVAAERDRVNNGVALDAQASEAPS